MINDIHNSVEKHLIVACAQHPAVEVVSFPASPTVWSPNDEYAARLDLAASWFRAGTDEVKTISLVGGMGGPHFPEGSWALADVAARYLVDTADIPEDNVFGTVQYPFLNQVYTTNHEILATYRIWKQMQEQRPFENGSTVSISLVVGEQQIPRISTTVAAIQKRYTSQFAPFISVANIEGRQFHDTPLERVMRIYSKADPFMTHLLPWILRYQRDYRVMRGMRGFMEGWREFRADPLTPER